MDLDPIIEEMEHLIRKGKDSYFIDNELKKYPLSPEEKGHIIAHLQEFEVDYIKKTTGKQGALIQLLVGAGILLLGYLGEFTDYSSSTSRYIIKFGAILGGGFIAWRGYRRYRRITSTGEPSKFRSKRFKRYE